VIIAQSRRLACLEHYTKCSFEDIHLKAMHSQHVYMCLLKVAGFIIKRALWAQRRLARRKEIFRKHGIYILYMYIYIIYVYIIYESSVCRLLIYESSAASSMCILSL
jgi:hypothetical protein